MNIHTVIKVNDNESFRDNHAHSVWFLARLKALRKVTLNSAIIYNRRAETLGSGADAIAIVVKSKKQKSLEKVSWCLAKVNPQLRRSFRCQRGFKDLLELARNSQLPLP